MAMGSFNRKRQYKQENPMANAGVLARLLGQQSQDLQSVGDAVELQGQNVGRQKVAELMGTDAFKTATPVEQQSMVQATTGGRRLGESGQQTLDNAFKMSGDVQSNKWKQDAATLLNSRQVARDATNNAASMNRVTAGKDTPTGQLLTPSQIAEKKEQIRQYDEAMLHPDVKADPALSSNMRKERDTLAGEMIYGSTKKPSATAVSAVTGVDKDGNLLGSKKKNTGKLSYPKALGRDIEQQPRDKGIELKERFDNNEFRVIPGEAVLDEDGKATGQYKKDTYFDSSGNPTTVDEILKGGKKDKNVKKKLTRADLTLEEQIEYDAELLKMTNAKNAKRFGR